MTEWTPTLDEALNLAREWTVGLRRAPATGRADAVNYPPPVDLAVMADAARYETAHQARWVNYVQLLLALEARVERRASEAALADDRREALNRITEPEPDLRLDHASVQRLVARDREVVLRVLEDEFGVAGVVKLLLDRAIPAQRQLVVQTALAASLAGTPPSWPL